MGAVKLGRETTHGTIANGFSSVAGNWSSKLVHGSKIYDEQHNGQDVNYSIITGRKHQQWTLADSPVYHDTCGLLLMSALGLATSTQVAAEGIYDSVMKMADDPVSLSAQWAQAKRNTQAYQSLNAVVDKLTLRFAQSGDLFISASGVGMPESDIAAPTYAFSTVKPFAEWEGAVTLGGGSFARLLRGSVTITRNRKPFFAINNTQNPASMSIGTRMVEYDLTCDFTSKAQYDNFKSATTDALQIVWTDSSTIIGSGSSNPKITVKLGTVAHTGDNGIDDQPDYPEDTLRGKALYNSSDASKIVVTVRSTSQYQVIHA